MDSAKFCTSCGSALEGAANLRPPPSSTLAPPVAPGSKVAFIAADGKTYTGTIHEFNGDQYRIKYDAFNFETWLKRNQFTVTAANAAAVGYVPNQNRNNQPFFTHQSSPGSFVTHPGFWGCILVVIGFFTNWLNPGLGAGISGFDILQSASGIISSPDEDGVGVFILATDAAIILSAIICLLYILGIGIDRGAFVFFKLLPLLSLIALLVYVIVKSQNKSYDDGGETGWNILGIGLYMTLAGSLLLAISKGRK
jgi:hypothetical protein